MSHDSGFTDQAAVMAFERFCRMYGQHVVVCYGLTLHRTL